MDKATATAFVDRIEAHRREEAAIFEEMRSHPDYQMHEDKVIVSILDARKRARDLTEESNGELDSFDWVNDGEGNYVPREEVEA